MAELVSKIYATALFDIVKNDITLANDLLNEYSTIKNEIQNNIKFLNILKSPVITIKEKHNILKNCFLDKINGKLLNFFFVLADKNRFNEIFNIYNEFLKLYNNEFNILAVTAVTAVEMPLELLNKLRVILEKQTKKTIILTSLVDPTILGGILFKMENKEIDNTIRTKLKNIQNNIKQAIL